MDEARAVFAAFGARQWSRQGRRWWWQQPRAVEVTQQAGEALSAWVQQRFDAVCRGGGE